MLALPEHLQMLRDTVRRVAQDRIGPRAEATDRSGEFDHELESQLWDLGLLTLTLPEEYGGIPERGTALCLCVEEVARVCASSALMMIIQAVGSFPILHAGSDAIRAQYGERLSTGRTLAAYLVTEPGAGSDVASIRTAARREGDGYVIDGSKCFATNGGVAGVYSVLARTGGSGHRGLSFFVVDRDTPGVRVGRKEDKLGQRGSNTTEVFLDGVRVPAANRLGEEGTGFITAMADFDMSRPAIAAQALGIAEGALAYALRYAAERSTFGAPIVEHQLIQAKLADAAIDVEAGRGLVYRAAARFDRGERNTQLAAMAKCFCGDAAMRITTEMIQVLGGYGYMKDHPLERMFRDAKLTQIFEGTNEIQRIVIARNLLREAGG